MRARADETRVIMSLSMTAPQEERVRQRFEPRMSGALREPPPMAEHSVRDWWSGALTAAGLSWPFLLPSITPLRWWMLAPLAVIGGMLRYSRRLPLRPMHYPLLGFLIVLMAFVGYAVIAKPLTDYGSEKLLVFGAMTAAAWLAAWRQRLLTASYARGLRGGLLATLLICLVVVALKRELYLSTSAYGVEELMAAVSTTGLPLAIAMTGCAFMPTSAKPWPLFLASLALLGLAVVCVLVRGRFDALVLVAGAALLVIGPPWRGALPRLALGAVLVGLGLFVLQAVLPHLGDSYEYFSRLQRGEMGGRTSLFTEAWRGFVAHPMGQGIGSFADTEYFYKYPHNIVLEVAYETGILGLLCISMLYFYVLRRVVQLWLSPQHRILAALLVLVFLHILKAGDISTFAFQWTLTYLVVVGVPLSPQWALEKAGP